MRGPSPSGRGARGVGRVWVGLLFGLVGIAACNSAPPPGEGAIAAYLERHGVDAGATRDAAVAVGDVGASAAARRVAITVERGEGIPDLDPGPGESDPYVVLEYEGERHRTSTAEGKADPVWGDTFILDLRPGSTLTVRLYDEDALTSDELLGTLAVELPAVAAGESKALVLAFRNGESGKVTLTVTGMAPR